MVLLRYIFVCVGSQGPNLIINQPQELLDGMSEWCKEHHGKVSCCNRLSGSVKVNLALNVIFEVRHAIAGC